MALSAVLFAFMNLFARLATTSASWSSVATVRAAIGAVVAFAVARLRKRSVVAKDRRGVLLRSVLGTISMLLTFYALSSRSLPLGTTVTLVQLTPVFVAALAPLVLRERTSPFVALAIAISLGGVVLVTRPAFLFPTTAHAVVVSSGPSATLTAAAALVAASTTALTMMLLRRIGQRESAEAIAFNYSVFATITLGAIAVFDLHLPSARDAACMVGAGIAAGLGQLAMTRAYALAPAARVGGLSYLTVVASAIFGAIALRELPGPTALVGMALVIGGGLLVTTRPC